MVLVDAAMERHLFQRAGRMLLLLAETENDMNLSGAAQAFVSLFPPAPGQVAQTEMPPQERTSLIREALKSKSARCRLLGIRACEAALQTRDFIRDVDDDEAWQTVKPWTPKSRSEYTKYYTEILDIIQQYLEILRVREAQYSKCGIITYPDPTGITRIARQGTIIIRYHSYPAIRR